MTQGEKILHDLKGQPTPFRVPEGYFENFEARLAQRLPQPEPRHTTVRLYPRLWRYAAAVAFVVGIGVALYLNNTMSKHMVLTEEETQDEYYNDELDYIMVGNMEIAEYLTEAE